MERTHGVEDGAEDGGGDYGLTHQWDVDYNHFQKKKLECDSFFYYYK